MQTIGALVPVEAHLQDQLHLCPQTLELQEEEDTVDVEAEGLTNLLVPLLMTLFISLQNLAAAEELDTDTVVEAEVVN